MARVTFTSDFGIVRSLLVGGRRRVVIGLLVFCLSVFRTNSSLVRLIYRLMRLRDPSS